MWRKGAYLSLCMRLLREINYLRGKAVHCQTPRYHPHLVVNHSIIAGTFTLIVVAIMRSNGLIARRNAKKTTHNIRKASVTAFRGVQRESSRKQMRGCPRRHRVNDMVAMAPLRVKVDFEGRG